MFVLGWACFVVGAVAIFASIARENVLVPVFMGGCVLVVIAIVVLLKDADVLGDHPEEWERERDDLLTRWRPTSEQDREA